MDISDKKQDTLGRPPMWPAPRTDIAKRLQKILPREGKAKIGERFFNGLSERGVESILSGKTEPPLSAVLNIARFFGLDPAWLAWGDQYGTYTQPAVPLLPLTGPGGRHSVPLIGLATCDVAGWYNAQAFAINAPLSFEGKGDLFAVVAVGTSMLPDGIKNGYVVYCDTGVEPQNGDAVYVKVKDETASIKRFLKKDAKWCYLQGWLDPEADGTQKPYTEKRSLAIIDTIACVVMVRRKA